MPTIPDYLEKLWELFPGYLVNLLEALTNPKSFIRRVTLQHNTQPVQTTRKAIIFLAFSCVTASLVGTVVMGVAVDNRSDLIHIAAVGFIFIVAVVTLEAAVVRLSWWIVGGRVPYRRIFLADCYFFGTTLLLCGVAALLFLGAQRAIGFEHPNVVIPIYTVGTLALCAWSWLVWDAYRNLNRVSIPRAFVAFGLALVLTVIVTFVNSLLLAGLISK